MIPIKLKLANFTSYGDSVPELDFSKFQLAAISGPNGAGKSSLLDALTWCLWGTSRLGDSSDQLVKLGQQKMSVGFSFELDKHNFTVIRSRSLKSGGSTSLEFYSGSTASPQVHNLTEGTIKATQQKIIETLHLSFETFSNSAFLRQGHADEFTTKGPTERKKILADILGLSHFDLLEEKAKEKIKEIQTKLQLLEYQTLEIEAELTQKEERSEKKKMAEEKIVKLETQIKEFEMNLINLRQQKETLKITCEQKDKLTQSFLENKKELEEIILQGKNRKNHIEQLQDQLTKSADLENKLKELKKLRLEKENLEKIRHQKLEIEKQILETTNQIELKKQHQEQVQSQIAKLQNQLKEAAKPGSRCPTCGQEIGKGEKAHLHSELSKQMVNLEKESAQVNYLAEEKTLLKLKQTLIDLKFEPVKYQAISLQIINLEKLEKEKEMMIQLQATLENEQKVVLEMRALFQNKKAQVDKLSTEIAKLPDFSEKLTQTSLEITNTENQLNLVRNEEKQARGLLGQINELISRTAQLEKTQKIKQQEKTSLQKDKGSFEELALAFGKKGIQSMIIETAIPELEEEANKLLDKLTEGRMKVRLETQKETRGKLAGGEKGIIETLEIIISDEMGERPYEAYSLDGNELVFIRQNGQIKSSPIQDLWNNQSSVQKDGKHQLQQINIAALCYADGQALWKKAEQILRHPSPKKILEVKAGPGNYSVRLTKNHSIYVFTPEGIKVKRTADLKPGDFLLSPKVILNSQSFNKIDFVQFISNEFKQKRANLRKPLHYDDQNIWSRIDQKINRFGGINLNLGKFLGLAVAEGSGQTSYSIAAGTNALLANEATRLASEIFGNTQRTSGFVSASQMQSYVQNSPGISSKISREQYRPKIGGRLVAEIVKNMVGKTASTKRIPEFIFNTSKATQLAFLQGLIAGDGHLSVYKQSSKSSVNITTISRRLTGEVIFLCRQLGIWARVENHGESGFRRGMNHQQSYRIVISGKKNLELLGLGKIVSSYDTATKYEGIPCQLLKIFRINNQRFPRGIADKKFNCGVQILPHIARDKYLQIENLIRDWNILEVRSITEITSSSDYVYDLVVPKNNSFVAGTGAILIHNSGGEQFRVNFALRLALSKLLTHRAGAKLQFLVIDEGFGTQDAQGRSRIVEALNIIKNDFEKILVITHLEELKEEFPVRIEVLKGPSGSSFKVIGI